MKPVKEFQDLYQGNLEKLLAEATVAGQLERVPARWPTGCAAA